MKNYKKIMFFTLIFSLSFVVVMSELKYSFVSAENLGKNFIFNKNLKIGDRNEDVRALQRILNKNPTTQVSSFGAGSPDNETDFFGQLTKNAVIKFQEFYSSDVLRPSGLASGTGFVGVATRLKLNSLAENMIENNQTSSISKSKSSQIQAKASGNSSSLGSYKVIAEPENLDVRVYNTSEYQVLPGDTVILTGEGFDPRANTVFLGENRSISNLTSNEEGTKISFLVPRDLQFGKYSVHVENLNGTSKNQHFDVSFIVTNLPAKRPMVENISPSPSLYDGEIVISGSGFKSFGNSVYSSFGNVQNLTSADGKTLKLKISSLSQIYKLKDVIDLVKGKNLEAYLYVKNENGISRNPVLFYVKM